MLTSGLRVTMAVGASRAGAMGLSCHRRLVSSRPLVGSSASQWQRDSHSRGGWPAARKHLHQQQQQQMQGVRAMAQRGGGNKDEDKSWSEVAENAVGLAKSVFKKVAAPVKKALGQDEATKLERQRQKEREELYKPPDLGGIFGGGLLGKAAGAMLGSAIKAVGQTMAEAAKEAQATTDRAAAAIEASSEVSSRMGGPVRVGPPMSQSSMSSSVNGRTTKQVTLVLPVQGPRGMAQAQVQASEGQDGFGDMQIRVLMPDGTAVNVSGSGRDGRGGSDKRSGSRVIEAEWKDVY